MLSDRLNKKHIFVLQPQDEIRHPYEHALWPLCEKVVWFSRYMSLMNYEKEEPGVLIVDLDCLSSPLEVQLQQIRRQFPGTDLIALSSSDSAQVALQCIRSGFADFLLKPTSPEELAWSVRKCQQHQEMIQRLAPDDSKTGLVRAVTQISSCTTPTLVQLYTLEYMQSVMHCEGAAWLEAEGDSFTDTEVLCSVPKNTPTSLVLAQVPNQAFPERLDEPLVHPTKGNKCNVLLACQNYPKSSILLWGVDKSELSHLSMAKLIQEHGDLCLLNLQKFEELKQQTFVDDLTGLYNSRFLKFAITNAIMKCRDPNQSFSILFIDVDHFKQVNDKYGHVIGSEFLVAIGKTIKNAVRGIDPAFRYGGDEFVVILHNADTEGARVIAERIRKNIERRVFIIQDQKLSTTVSIGIATYPVHAAERETLLQLADEAMYSAKKSTRNAVHLALGLERPAKTGT
ncbi:MAG: diguanylate cyclase [Bdellovibrionales bacterium]|nr:diguanylate cyclase [Bdellovibrionales bacterium]